MAGTAVATRARARVAQGAVVIKRVGGAALAKSKAALAKTKSALSAARRNAGGMGGDALTAGITVIGGGGQAAALQVYFPEVGGIDSRLIVGGVEVAAALFAPLPKKVKGGLLAAAAGTLACAAEDIFVDLIDGEG